MSQQRPNRTQKGPGKKIEAMKAKIVATLKSIDHVIVVASGKGGVGKTTIAVNLAAGLAKKGYSVGVLDADITGPNVPKMFGLEGKHPEFNQIDKKIIPIKTENDIKVISMAFLLQRSDDAVIWRGPLKMGAINQLLGDVEWGNLDYLVIDLPPGTSDEPLSIAQMIPDADGVVIVTTPQEVALLDVKKSINFVKKVKLPVLGIVENMSSFLCPHCGKEITIFSKDGGRNAAEEFDIPFLGSIPLDPEIVPLSDAGKTIIDSETQSEKAFMEMVEKVVKEIEEK
ncbi:MAG: Mrp/NBP35 family ATP-binding protein [Asgard group archaeon]|nr:Mrp/NBP35 family ATP-binding protein [Asgard group archaeon]